MGRSPRLDHLGSAVDPSLAACRLISVGSRSCRARGSFARQSPEAAVRCGDRRRSSFREPSSVPDPFSPNVTGPALYSRCGLPTNAFRPGGSDLLLQLHGISTLE